MSTYGFPMGMWVIIGLAVAGSILSWVECGPATEMCREAAEARHIPCMAGTIRWDDDECECQSREGGYEIEFARSGAGCDWD